MKREMSNAPIYVLHFTDKNFRHDVETFGSISALVNYLLKLDVTNLKHKPLRILIVSSMNQHEEFELKYNDLPSRCFFVSKHEMKIETRIHS